MVRLGFFGLLLIPTLALARSPSPPPEKLPLGAKPTPLLADHLAMQLPEGARVEARQVSVMSAAEPDADETRAVLDLGDTRFVVMAQELHALAGPDFARAVRDTVKAGTVDPLAVAAPLAAMAVTPPPLDWDRAANLVFSAYVAHPDGTVQLVAFFVSPKGKKRGAAWAALARRAAATLTAGSRRVAASGGERHFGPTDGTGIRVNVPAGHSSTLQEGPDFLVVRVRPVVELGKPFAGCGIYIGGHPGYMYERAEVAADAVKRAPGKLLGVETEWLTWTQEGTSTVEAIVAHPAGRGLKVHAFCDAPSVAELGPLRALVENARRD